MDTDLLKTFLELHRTRHFGRAAENLYLTQSAVSARIRLLEQQVGVPLFTRARNNIQLTPSGEKLLRHAETILTTWNRARQEVAVEGGKGMSLAAGGVPSLWDMFLQQWLHTLYRNVTNVSLCAEVHGAETLIRRVLEGTLDVAFVFDSPQATELHAEEIARVDLVLVSSRPGLSAIDALRDDYVLVDWGTSFALRHAREFSDAPTPRIRMPLGRLAQAFLLDCGGSAYLARPMVEEDILAGRLHLVENVPIIERAVFAVYQLNSGREEVVKIALAWFPR
jgi:DNA-binding transcriptional LysR family regulator